MKIIIILSLLIATPMVAHASSWYWCSDQQCSTQTTFSSSKECSDYKKNNGGYCRPAPSDEVKIIDGSKKASFAELKAAMVSIEKKQGLIANTAAAPKACSSNGQPCNFSSDCCGDKLFCLGGSAGQSHYCREVGGK